MNGIDHYKEAERIAQLVKEGWDYVSSFADDEPLSPQDAQRILRAGQSLPVLSVLGQLHAQLAVAASNIVEKQLASPDTRAAWVEATQ